MRATNESSPLDEHFRSTAWSLIRDAQSPDGGERSAALERLAALYWAPVNGLIRRRFGFDPDEAQDLTQDYFTMLLEGKFLDDVGPHRGSFRAYVMATTGNFVRNHLRSARTAKRGGGHRRVPFSQDGEQSWADDRPDATFDRDLMHAVIENALAGLATECVARGDEIGHPLFIRFYLQQGDGGVSYETLQDEFDLGLHEVKNRLARLRAAFRRHVLVLLRDGISTEDELISEIREVFGR